MAPFGVLLRPPYRRAIRLCRAFVRNRGAIHRIGRFPLCGKAEDITKDHGPSIKNDAVYEALLKDGASEEKAARIANAKAAGSLKQRGAKLEDRTKADLLREARTIGIAGRSKMSKPKLAQAIRAG
jgi:hypothetical protein